MRSADQIRAKLSIGRMAERLSGNREPGPAVVFFHGGGFVIGNIETHDGLCRMMANEGGMRVISVDYRLAPENKYPAAIDDAFAALTWVSANAKVADVNGGGTVTGYSLGMSFAAGESDSATDCPRHTGHLIVCSRAWARSCYSRR